MMTKGRLVEFPTQELWEELERRELGSYLCRCGKAVIPIETSDTCITTGCPDGKCGQRRHLSRTRQALFGPPGYIK